MIQKIEELDAQLQELFKKINFPSEVIFTAKAMRDFASVVLEFTNPAKEIIQVALNENSSNEFKKDVVELIKKYRLKIAQKFNYSISNSDY